MRTCLFALLLALGIPAANATPIRYDFTVSLTSFDGTQPGSGPADGSGYVTFDTDLFALANSSGLVGDYNNPLPTIDLAFDWLGLHWDQSNATLSIVNFDPSGNVSYWGIDAIVPANFCTNNFWCVQWGTTDFTATSLGSALLTQQGVQGVAFGSVVVTGSQEVLVPEPGTFGIMVLGLAGVWLLRRKSA